MVMSIQKRYGSSEFADIIGVSRMTLQRMKVSGELPGNLDKRTNHVYYLYNDFTNPYVKERMKKANRVLPQALKDEILDAVLQGGAYEQKSPAPKVKVVHEQIVNPTEAKLTLVDKPNIKKGLIATTKYFDLELLPEGLLKEIIPPIEGLDYIGRSTWNMAIKTLVAQGTFKVADMQSLIQYCQTADQLEAYRADISEFVDVLGKVNPLLGEITRCKTTMRGLAKDLHLNPDSRKNVTVPEDGSVDDHTKGWMEVVK